MDSAQARPDRTGTPQRTTLAFAAFVLAHDGCDAAMEESRLDHHTLACRCPRCGEARVFRREA